MLLEKSHTKDSPANPVAFICDSDKTGKIFLAESFNGWDPIHTPMVRCEDGRWNVSLKLAPGRYENKFVVDGERCCEPGCSALGVERAHCIVNDFGTMNRVREVM